MADSPEWLDEEMLGEYIKLDRFNSRQEVIDWVSGRDLTDYGRWRFSIHYLQNAVLSHEEAVALEDTHESESGKQYVQGINILHRYRGEVISGILNSVTYLEAFVNEVYQEFLDDADRLTGDFTMPDSGVPLPHQLEVSKLNEAVSEDDVRRLQRLDSFNSRGFTNLPILKKYQYILSVTDNPTFDPGAMPYQDVSTACRLRNYFIHYDPEYIAVLSEDPDNHPLGDALIGKFEPIPLLPEPSESAGGFFPLKAVGTGCLRWVLDSVLDFVEEFADRLGLNLRLRRDGYNLSPFISEES